mgnify:CR=1 FL=1
MIGTPGSFGGDKGHWYMSAFDGDPYTSFDYNQPDGGWAGIDLGKPVSVGKIVFTPRIALILFAKVISTSFSMPEREAGFLRELGWLIPIHWFIMFLKGRYFI